MTASPSVFPLAHITLTAAITTVVALVALVAVRPRLKAFSLLDCLLVAGLSVLVWRSAGNTGALNADPLPGVSPNDVITPLVTYLCLGMYTAVRRPVDASRFEQVRVLLTLISLVVNVVTI